IMEMEHDIDNMTINDYMEYEAEKERQLWRNVRSKISPTRPFKPHNKCGYESPDTSDEDVDNISDLEKEEAQEKDGDKGDIYDMWEITIEDIERIRKFLTPNVPDVINDVTQPLIPKTIHTTPPDEDYVAPATKSILDELLEEFRDEILNLTMVSEEADFNHTKDIEE
ncbi:hypothetical protein Tco_1564666, partial [Tanacetum coccineum]